VIDVSEPARIVALAVSVPLAIRSQWPITVLAVVLISAIVAVLLGMSEATTALAVAVALYAVALSVGPRPSAAALGAALLSVTLTAVLTATVLRPYFNRSKPLRPRCCAERGIVRYRSTVPR
jgi:hypothetical protein